jgi:hypothetical protein
MPRRDCLRAGGGQAWSVAGALVGSLVLCACSVGFLGGRRASLFKQFTITLVVAW